MAAWALAARTAVAAKTSADAPCPAIMTPTLVRCVSRFCITYSSAASSWRESIQWMQLTGHESMADCRCASSAQRSESQLRG